MSSFSQATVATIVLILSVGCSENTASNETVAEGVIYYVEYTLPGGGTGGFTRLNMAEAVPGGTGSWNVDAYGRLTRDFLLVTRPQQPDLGEQVIPVERIVKIQFGTGGIDRVGESKPTTP